MKKLIFASLVISSPAWCAAKKPLDLNTRNDNCAPIGRTEDGKLVYSMKCENLPSPPPREETSAAPAERLQQRPEESTTVRSGLFGLSYERKPVNGQSVPNNRPDTR